MSQVFMSSKKRAKLKEKFGVSEQTLSAAVHFKKKSELSRRIRSYAVNRLNAFVLL